MPRPVAPVSHIEAIVVYAHTRGIALSPERSALLKPAVLSFRENVWMSGDQVRNILTGACEGKDNAWRNTFLAGSDSVDLYLNERKDALLNLPNAADLIYEDAAGAVTYSPHGFGNLLLMLGGELGHDLQGLFSDPNAIAEIKNAADRRLRERLQLRNDNADEINANKAEIVTQGIADNMFLPREEKRFYSNTVGSMNKTLEECGYTPAERRGSKRQFHSLAMATNRKQMQLLGKIALNNHRPGGTLANETPAQMKQRLQNVNDASVQSYNQPRATLARRREDAVVPRQE